MTDEMINAYIDGHVDVHKSDNENNITFQVNSSRTVQLKMGNRDLNLDFVKGILVIIMVIYHTMNYFSTASPEYYGYLRFINGSFIFISGYIISIFYDKKYQLDKKIVYKRLIGRGLKLLTLFTGLNFIISLIGVTSYQKVHFGLQQYLNNLSAIYISGNGDLMAFQILVPISYVLIISPIYFIFYELRTIFILVTGISAFSYTFLNIDSPNLFLGLIGLVGLSIGILVNMERLFFISNLFIIFFCLFVSTTIMNYLSGNVLTYSLGILIVLKLMYDLAKMINLERGTCQMVILLGQHSLVCYIAQIVFLYGLHRLLLNQKWALGYEIALIVIVANIFLVWLCFLLRYLRNRYKLIDKSYKFIFA